MSATAPPTSDLAELDDLLVIRPRPPAVQDTDIDITPMIDMVFLLLIFFLVTSRISQQASVEIPEARYGGAISSKEAVVVTLAQQGDDVAIFKGDSVDPSLRLQSADLAAQERELIAYVQTELAGGTLKHHVLIKAGKDVKHKHVARVSQAVGQVPGVSQLYVAVREAQ